jgi:hypothetical protein
MAISGHVALLVKRNVTALQLTQYTVDGGIGGQTQCKANKLTLMLIT